MMSYLLIFLAFSLAESNHVVPGPWVPDTRVAGTWVPRASDVISCLKTHSEIRNLFSLYVISNYNLVTYFCQPKNFPESEKWYTYPPIQSDSKSFLLWSSSLIEPPCNLTNQIWLALHSGYISNMPPPEDGDIGEGG